MSICICWFHFHIESAECMVMEYLEMNFTGFITQEMCLCLPKTSTLRKSLTLSLPRA